MKIPLPSNPKKKSIQILMKKNVTVKTKFSNIFKHEMLLCTFSLHENLVITNKQKMKKFPFIFQEFRDKKENSGRKKEKF
jgi:hypothetical protein